MMPMGMPPPGGMPPPMPMMPGGIAPMTPMFRPPMMGGMGLAAPPKVIPKEEEIQQRAEEEAEKTRSVLNLNLAK